MSRFAIALLEIDDDQMPEGSDFYGEMGWVSQSGISMIDDIQLNDLSSNESARLFETLRESVDLIHNIISLRQHGNSDATDLTSLTVSIHPDDETPVSVCDNLIRVDWVNLDEGHCGNYDPDDPEDENLLRFDAYINPDPKHRLDIDSDEWEEIEDASYCTNIPADTPIDTLVALCKTLHKRYRLEIDNYPVPFSVKKLGEELSWISPSNILPEFAEAEQMEKKNLFSASVRCPKCKKAMRMRVSDVDDYAYQCLDCDEDFYSIECPDTVCDYRNKDGDIVSLYQITLHRQNRNWYIANKNRLKDICNKYQLDFMGCDDAGALSPTDEVFVDFGWEKAPDSDTVQRFTNDVMALLTS